MKTINYYFLGIVAYLQQAINTLRKSEDFDYCFKLGKKKYRAQFMGLAWVLIIAILGFLAAMFMFVAVIAINMLP